MLESELITKLKEIFIGSPYRDIQIDLEHHDPKKGTLTIRISQMYDFVDVSFDQLSKLSELAQTRGINFGSKTSRGGCETCDYGSSYEIRLILDNFWIPLKKDPVDRNNKRRNRR